MATVKLRMSQDDFWACSLNTFQALVEAHNYFNDPERSQKAGARGSISQLEALCDRG